MAGVSAVLKISIIGTGAGGWKEQLTVQIPAPIKLNEGYHPDKRVQIK
jgi:hypothetical protein